LFVLAEHGAIGSQQPIGFIKTVGSGHNFSTPIDSGRPTADGSGFPGPGWLQGAFGQLRLSGRGLGPWQRDLLLGPVPGDYAHA
jgi:hypothetical protein